MAIRVYCRFDDAQMGMVLGAPGDKARHNSSLLLAFRRPGNLHG